MKDTKRQHTLLSEKRRTLSFFSDILPTLWNLMLCKPLQYACWPFVTQIEQLPHCSLQVITKKYSWLLFITNLMWVKVVNSHPVPVNVGLCLCRE